MRIPKIRFSGYNQLNNQSVNRKTASDTIHSLYLDTVKWFYLIVLASFIAGLSWTAYKVYQYFKSNSLPEMAMDFLIIALPTILIYSIVKQVRRVKKS